MTFDANYIESVWHLLKALHEKDLLYKGYTVQPFSPAAGTGLSSHELNQPGTYKIIKDTSVVAQFKVKRNRKSAFLFDHDMLRKASTLNELRNPITDQHNSKRKTNQLSNESN